MKSRTVSLSLSQCASALVVTFMIISAFALAVQHVRAMRVNTDYTAIDTFVESQMDAWHIPGAALAIVRDDEFIHLRGFGWADSTGRAVTPQTPFEIGSCTKSFTALTMLQLAEQAKVELDAPVQEYLPWFRVADADASARITIRHLLNHTSGISQADSNKRVMINPRGLTLEGHIRALQDVTLSVPPGATYQYSNLNYMTLALIIEKVTGQSYGDYLRENVFTPLKMQNSFTDVTEARQHGLSDGHTWWFGVPFKSFESPRPDMLGAGYVMVSAEDMSHYLLAQLNNGVYEKTRALSTESVALMHKRTKLPIGESEYGMGWDSYTDNGLTHVNHNGASAGFTCSMILIPEKKLGVAVLTNVGTLLPPHAAWSLAYNVKNMLLTEKPTEIDHSYRDFFLPWNAGFLIATFHLLWSLLFDLPRWRRKISTKPPESRNEHVRHMVLPTITDGVVALALLFGIPIVKGFEIWRGMFVWQPDAVCWTLTFGVLMFLKTIARMFHRKGSKQ